MNLLLVHDFMKDSSLLLMKVADELFVMDKLNKLNSEAYVTITKIYDELFKLYQVMDQANGWTENLTRIPVVKSKKIDVKKASEIYDEILALQEEQTAEWQRIVGERIQTSPELEDMFKNSYIQGAEIASERLSIELDFHLNELNLEKAFAERKKILNKAMADGIIDSVNKTIADLYANQGMGPDEIAKKIKKLVPETYANRARTIARTETNYAASRAQYDVYKANGIIRKELLIEPDACPICVDAQIAMENSSIDTGAMDSFGQFVMYPPFHPSCRCAIIPVVITPETTLIF